MTVFHPPERYLQTRRSNGTNNDDVKEASPNNQSNVRDASDHTSPNHAIGAGVCKPGSTSNASAVWRKVRLRVVTVRVQGKQPGQVVETYAKVPMCLFAIKGSSKSEDLAESGGIST